jgi:pimeloyl-ACP methyl ester carboxylesterase
VPYVPLAAGRVYYSERGERDAAKTPALFIHGAGASSTIWSMVVARVARHRHSVAIDLPGHGPSEAGDGPLTLQRYRDAVGGLAATLCLGPSVLVGHSLGALCAIEAALAWPDKVRALILCAAAPRMPVDPEVFRLLRDDPEGFIPWLADHALSPRSKPAVRRGFMAANALAGAPAARESARADFEIVQATDVTARVASVTCPVAWLDGVDDQMVPAAERTNQRPGAIVSVRDAGHLLPIEAPAAIAELVSSAP